MIITMNTCKYPEIKFIGCLDLQSVSNKNKKNYKNKNIFLPTYPNFFQEVTGNTHIIFLGLSRQSSSTHVSGCYLTDG